MTVVASATELQRGIAARSRKETARVEVITSTEDGFDLTCDESQRTTPFTGLPENVFQVQLTESGDDSHTKFNCRKLFLKQNYLWCVIFPVFFEYF